MVNNPIDPMAMANPQGQGNIGMQIYKSDKFTSNHQTAQNIIKNGRNVHNSAITNQRGSVLS